jgi:hypothetical protein
MKCNGTNSSYFGREAIPDCNVRNLHHKIHGFSRFNNAEIEALGKEIEKFLNHVYIGTKYK